MYDNRYVVRRSHRLDSVDELQQLQRMLGNAVIRPRCELKLTNFTFVKVVTLDTYRTRYLASTLSAIVTYNNSRIYQHLTDSTTDPACQKCSEGATHDGTLAVGLTSTVTNTTANLWTS